jgi:hypothetical protein
VVDAAAAFLGALADFLERQGRGGGVDGGGA